MPGLPDMVFTANGATIIDGKMLGSQFRYPQRAAEAPAFLDWGDRAGAKAGDARVRACPGRRLRAAQGRRRSQVLHPGGAPLTAGQARCAPPAPCTRVARSARQVAG